MIKESYVGEVDFMDLLVILSGSGGIMDRDKEEAHLLRITSDCRS